MISGVTVNCKNTQRHGTGTLKTAQNGVYEGSWDRDMKHGAGKELYPNGDMYEGTWELNRVSPYLGYCVLFNALFLCSAKVKECCTIRLGRCTLESSITTSSMAREK